MFYPVSPNPSVTECSDGNDFIVLLSINGDYTESDVIGRLSNLLIDASSPNSDYSSSNIFFEY
jgi:hypothetical protein